MEGHEETTQPAEPTEETLRAGHEESLKAAENLVEKVEATEDAEGGPVPSQKDADETAATGI